MRDLGPYALKMRMEFTGEDGRVHVRARTVWALLDRASGRPLRVTGAVVAPFLSSS